MPTKPAPGYPVFTSNCALQVDVLEYYDALVHSARHEFMIPAVLRVRMYIQRDNKGQNISHAA